MKWRRSKKTGRRKINKRKGEMIASVREKTNEKNGCQFTAPEAKIKYI